MLFTAYQIHYLRSPDKEKFWLKIKEDSNGPLKLFQLTKYLLIMKAMGCLSKIAKL